MMSEENDLDIDEALENLSLSNLALGADPSTRGAADTDKDKKGSSEGKMVDLSFPTSKSDDDSKPEENIKNNEEQEKIDNGGQLSKDDNKTNKTTSSESSSNSATVEGPTKETNHPNASTLFEGGGKELFTNDLNLTATSDSTKAGNFATHSNDNSYSFHSTFNTSADSLLKNQYSSNSLNSQDTELKQNIQPPQQTPFPPNLQKTPSKFSTNFAGQSFTPYKSVSEQNGITSPSNKPFDTTPSVIPPKFQENQSHYTLTSKLGDFNSVTPGKQKPVASYATPPINQSGYNSYHPGLSNVYPSTPSNQNLDNGISHTIPKLNEYNPYTAPPGFSPLTTSNQQQISTRPTPTLNQNGYKPHTGPPTLNPLTPTNQQDGTSNNTPYSNKLSKTPFASPRPNNSGLFIPSIYSPNKAPETSSSTNSQFFVPSAPLGETVPSVSATQNSSYDKPSFGYGQQQTYSNISFDQDNQMNGYSTSSADQQGIWNWIKKAVGGDFKQQLKHATDSVLTTLDPGMEDYLKPASISIGIASQDISILHGVKQAFTEVFGNVDIKSQSLPSYSPNLPNGYNEVMNCINEDLSQALYLNFGTSVNLVICSKVFISELSTGRLALSLCFGMKDITRNSMNHSFSQPIPLPEELMETLNQNQSSTQNGFTIQQLLKMYQPYETNNDWASVFSGGLQLSHLSYSASSYLAFQYRKMMKNQQLNQQQQQYSNYQQHNQQQISYPPPTAHAYQQSNQQTNYQQINFSHF